MLFRRRLLKLRQRCNAFIRQNIMKRINIQIVKRFAAVFITSVTVFILSGCSGKNKAVIMEKLSEEQALSAVKNYCCTINPDLENILKEGEYPVYWEIVSSDEQEIVVLFRSYTGALCRYYIDRVKGDTYVTEYVPEITSEEQRTDEKFNIRDYF